ncbi:MAG: hypothetical protein CG439_1711 [Methylococcaceae bacterium NSP1-2]|nr:hypothetical protein [Methylococcaceae bacterium]OYV17389.1 MAG: hypothetical protein CG439_1711 [Methylococcaceae bacterium NSP1-2]
MKDHFSQLYANQELLFKALANLQKDRLFLQQLLHEQSSDTVLQIKGLGLFKANPKSIANQTLQHLQALINKTYGVDFLADRVEQLNKTITRLTPSDWSKPLATPVYTLAEHYQDVQTARHAIQLLQQDVAAETITLNQPLTPADTQRLEHFQQQLQNNILSLLNSKRPDWGYALLINIARLMAVNASLTAQHWVFIDDFAEHSEQVPSEQIPDLAAQLQTAKQRWLAAKPSTQFTEMAYSRLEMTANHYAELSKAGEVVTIRYTGEQALPDKPAPLIIDSVPNLSVAELKQALADLDHYETRLHQQLAHHNRYDLVTRNCVTELFRTIDDAILNSPALRLTNSTNTHLEQPLGGHIRADYNFIPWVSFQSVQSQLHVSDSQLLPSYRGLQLEKLANQPLESLKEISTLTSSSYLFNSDDAWFVFFTDDMMLLRPVFGAFNIATAITQSIFGLFSLPFDDGENLHAGAVGFLMSAPELVFINIRKGSYPYLSPALALSNEVNRLLPDASE